MRILLHICCGPCAIYPFRRLAEFAEGPAGGVTGFFYNPNIHPIEEYERRRSALADYSEKETAEILFGEHNPEDFFKRIGDKGSSPERCRICWQMRLEKTAETARKGLFDAFTTTLLASPYQDQDAIKEIGTECGKRFMLQFLSLDFRSGFRDAQKEAKELGVYRQKYCGCRFSMGR